MNNRECRIELAHAIFNACNGDIDKAMKHKNMPYKRKSNIQKIARDYKWYENDGIFRSRRPRISQEGVEKILAVFLETNGCVSKTAKLTGYNRNTVSRYAKANDWNSLLLQKSVEIMNQDKKDSATDEIIITEILKELREKLLNVLMKNGQSSSDKGSSLGIAPKTLSEVIKALIDIDKRIADREHQNSSSKLDPYLIVLEKCGDMMLEKSEDESDD